MKEINMEIEIWKKIPGFSNYKISTWGRIKSYKQDRINGKLLKLYQKKSGYIAISLTNDNSERIRGIGVHRLVALTFIPNPENKPQVNHIDEDKTNNYVNNLEWVTSKENNNHGTHNERVGRTKGKKVQCIETGEIYYSTREALRKTGIRNISQACRGIYKYAGGFHWRYIE